MYAIFLTDKQSSQINHTMNRGACGLYSDRVEAEAEAAKQTKASPCGHIYYAVELPHLPEKIVEVENIVEVEKLPEVLCFSGLETPPGFESLQPVGSFVQFNGETYRLHASDVHGNDTYVRQD